MFAAVVRSYTVITYGVRRRGYAVYADTISPTASSAVSHVRQRVCSMHACVHMHILLDVHTLARKRLYCATQTHTPTCMHVYVHIYIHTHAHLLACLPAYLPTYPPADLHTYIRTDRHTHASIRPSVHPSIRQASQPYITAHISS